MYLIENTKLVNKKLFVNVFCVSPKRFRKHDLNFKGKHISKIFSNKYYTVKMKTKEIIKKYSHPQLPIKPIKYTTTKDIKKHNK